MWWSASPDRSGPVHMASSRWEAAIWWGLGSPDDNRGTGRVGRPGVAATGRAPLPGPGLSELPPILDRWCADQQRPLGAVRDHLFHRVPDHRFGGMGGHGGLLHVHTDAAHQSVGRLRVGPLRPAQGAVDNQQPLQPAGGDDGPDMGCGDPQRGDLDAPPAGRRVHLRRPVAHMAVLRGGVRSEGASPQRHHDELHTVQRSPHLRPGPGRPADRHARSRLGAHPHSGALRAGPGGPGTDRSGDPVPLPSVHRGRWAAEVVGGLRLPGVDPLRA